MGEQKVEEGLEQRTYFKIKALFRCSGEKWRKGWESYHAWERKEKPACPYCKEVGEIDRFLDEMCELDNYHCGSESCDSYHWQSIHNGNEEACHLCDTLTKPQGTQMRHGRHTYFICANASCMKTWEDYAPDPRSQRCRKCHCRGDVVQTINYKLKKQEEGEEEKAIPGMLGGGRHDHSNCDMCRDLKKQGRGMSCIKARRVLCKAKKGEGANSEIIVQVEVMRNLKIN